MSAQATGSVCTCQYVSPDPAVSCCRAAPQARAVIDGLPADMVALALPLDVQKIADAGLLRQDWRKMYPLQSVGEHVDATVVCRPPV